jgi:flagellar hook protein FlgE
MSLNGAITAAVFGLKANAQALGASSDDTANSRAIAYKRTQTTFSSLVSTSTGGSYIPGGVEAHTQRVIEEVGNPAQTSSQTDLYIEGKGFFVVDTGGATSRKLFTRVGDFFPDNQSKLKNSSGHYLMGWRTDPNGIPVNGNLNSLASLETVDISVAAGGAQQTKSFRYGLNLPQQDLVGKVYTNNETIYDSLGVPHEITFTWTKTEQGDGSTLQMWTLSVTGSGATIEMDAVGGGAYTSVPIEFDGIGSPASFNGDSTSTATMPALAITWANGADASSISFDIGNIGELSGVTAYYGDNLVNRREQDGGQVGNFIYSSVDADGIVTAFFDNQTKVKIYKVPVATVPNARGMTAITGNAFTIATASGNFNLNVAGAGGSGYIRSQKLEESTVDIATVFSQMTLCNQNFSACSESFRTANEMYRELKQLQR